MPTIPPINIKKLHEFPERSGLDYDDLLHVNSTELDYKIQATKIADFVQADLFYDTLAELIAETDVEKVKAGKRVVTFANQNGAAIKQEWKIVDSTALPQDGGQSIALTGTGKYAEQVFGDSVRSVQFGTVTTSNFAALLSVTDTVIVDSAIALSGFDISQSFKVIKFTSTGSFIPEAGAATFMLRVSGSDNKFFDPIFDNVSGGKKRSLHITGNNNRVYGGSASETAKRTDLTVLYDRANIRVDGDHNKIYHFNSFNSGMGIDDNGQHTVIKHCDVHDNITGVHMTASSRYAVIHHNEIHNNDVNNASGADGILGTRNASYFSIMHNHIYANGEHGVYVQGHDFTIFNNYAYGNWGSGIKLASYQSSLEWRAGETPILLFINGGGVGIDTYVGFGGKIVHNYTWGNSGGAATNAGIFGQANRLDDTIHDNDCRDELGYGIRYVYFESGTELVRNITITNNKVYNCVNDEIVIACDSGLKINSNETDGVIKTYSVSAGAPSLSPELTGNIAAQLIASRSSGARITGGKLGDFSTSSTSGAILDGVEITNQTAASTWTGVSNIINKCKITTDSANTSGLNSFAPTTMTNSTFDFTSVTANYPIDVTAAKNGADYSHNTFVAPNIPRIMRLGSSFNRSSISHNKFDFNNAVDYTLIIQGDSNTVIGNNGLDTNNMQIRLDVGADSNVVGLNRATISDAGAGNVVANNL